MIISLFLDHELEAARLSETLTAMQQLGFAPQGGEVLIRGPIAHQPLKPHPAFFFDRREGEVDLEVAFLDGDRHRTSKLLRNHHVPKLLIGPRGLPNPLDHVTVPFEHHRNLEPWLNPLLNHIKGRGWSPHLLYCDRSWVSQEILKLADWFHLDPVKEAMKEWVNQDTLTSLADLIHAHPELKVHTAVGPLRKLLSELGRDNILFVGSLSSGYHLPNRHHGLNYGRLLRLSGGSGYFLTP